MLSKDPSVCSYTAAAADAKPRPKHSDSTDQKGGTLKTQEDPRTTVSQKSQKENYPDYRQKVSKPLKETEV